MINFKSIPFFKILFPFVFGIICALQFGLFSNIHLVCIFSFVTLIITFLFQKFYKPTLYLKKGVYIFSANIFLFVLAFESCYLYNAKNNVSHYSHFVSPTTQTCIATINDIPVITEKFIKLNVQVNAINFNNTWHYAIGKTIIYLKKDSLLNLSLGNKLFINSKFSYLNEPKNPEEFNYKTFLENKNIFHTVFANSNQIQVVSRKSNFHINNVGVFIKSHLVSVLRNSKLSQEAFSICSALLVGYDDEIDSGVMQSFSHSGTLHVLSVSGMHTAVLYAVLIFLFSLFDKHDKFKKSKFVFVIVFLWLFVLVTGLSPSILRAALMLSLVLVGKTFYKQGNSYNTLLLSAFLLLLFNPLLIKDVGFLLSYSAVFGIMYLYPMLQKEYLFENKLLQNMWSGVLMSVAATLFTLPISLYFFHQFPIWFVLSNMIIIPISMVMMGAAALFLIFYKIAIINQALVFIINGATSLMLWFAQLTDIPKFGYIDMIPFSKLDVIFSSALIIFFLIVIHTKQYKHIVAFCFIIISWISFSIYNSYKTTLAKEFLVFHIKQKSALALRIGNSVYCNFEDFNETDYQRFIKPYLLTIPDCKLIKTNSNLLIHSSVTILNTNKSIADLYSVNPNYVVVSNDTSIELTTNYKTKPVIIADCSNSYKFVKKLKKQCALLDLPFYSVKESGAFQIQL